MMRYAQTAMCRELFIKEYFGEKSGGLCGRCDNCRNGLAAQFKGQGLREGSKVASGGKLRFHAQTESEEPGKADTEDL
jgi:superfamily II DNA helicase RecQ